MKVKELIALLSNVNPEMQVFITNDYVNQAINHVEGVEIITLTAENEESIGALIVAIEEDE